MSTIFRLSLQFSILVMVGLSMLIVPQPALAATELIINGGFETGNFSGWTAEHAFDDPNIASVWCASWQIVTATPCVFEPVTPSKGMYMAFNSMDGVPMEFTLYQDVTIPAASTALFSFMYRAQWYNYNRGWTQARTMDVQIRNTSNTILETIHHFSTGNAVCCFIHEDTHWITVSADLSAYAGQTIRLFLVEDVPQIFTGGSQIYFDDFSLQAYTGSVGKINITQSGGTTTPAEGGASDSFIVTLSQAPTADVLLGLSAGAQCRINGKLTDTVTLNSTNWSTGAVVTVTAVNDGMVEGNHLCMVTTVPASSSDAAFHTVDPVDVPVTIFDNNGTRPQITNCPPPVPTAGEPFNYRFTGTGSPAPIFTYATDFWPQGITMNSSGVVSGTPPSAHGDGLVINISAESIVGFYDTITFRPTVRPAVANPPIFTNPVSAGDHLNDHKPMPGMVGKFYCFRFQTMGNPTPTFTLSGASLPAGLTFSDDIISGIPTEAITTNPIMVTATNNHGSFSQNFTLTMYPARAVPAVTSSSPPPAVVGLPYSHTFTATGGPTPQFGLNGAPLPPGLTFANNTISGTPTTAGNYGVISAVARNSIGQSAAQDFALTVYANPIPPDITSALPSAGMAGAAYSHTFTATGLPTPTFTISGASLPAGLTWNGVNGISGTPLVSGTSGSITVTASNGAMPNDSQTFTIAIHSPSNAAPSRNYFTTATPTLYWGSITGATLYEVEVYNNVGLTGDPVYEYSGAANETTVTPALPDGVYYWRARAITPTWTGAWSAVQKITING